MEEILGVNVSKSFSESLFFICIIDSWGHCAIYRSALRGCCLH